MPSENTAGATVEMRPPTWHVPLPLSHSLWAKAFAEHLIAATGCSTAPEERSALLAASIRVTAFWQSLLLCWRG